MQDRFKYRFFDVEDKKMYDVKNICFIGEPTVTVDYKPVIKKAIYRGYLMQSTGLKDVNGELIYEGDIVSVKVEIQDFFGEDEYYSENYKGKIIFEKGEIAIDVIDITRHLISLFFNIKGCEVIGNIYENPELLSEAE